MAEKESFRRNKLQTLETQVKMLKDKSEEIGRLEERGEDRKEGYSEYKRLTLQVEHLRKFIIQSALDLEKGDDLE